MLLFGYGSLVHRASAEETVGHQIGELEPATIVGWRRRWSLLRDNPYCEKTFALTDGSVPDWLLTLNIEPTGDRADRVNGVLVELTDADIPALDLREIRYRRVDVETEDRTAAITYSGKHRSTAIIPPAGALILAAYLRAVEDGFRALGPGQLEAFHSSTGEPPVPIVEGHLIRHQRPGPRPVRW